MTEQNNFTKDTKQLIIEFVDNCNEGFQELEKLICLNQKGLKKCFEWAEKFETKLNGLVNLFDVVNKKQDGNSIKIEKLETHLEKVHDLVNLEDRITACDVLNRLTLLEGKIHPDSTLPFALSLNDRMELIENFYNEQKEIVDKLNDQDKSGFMWQKGQIEALYERVKILEKAILPNPDAFYMPKKPYKCPNCDALGGTKISGTIDEECSSCKGTGIVWG